MSIIFDQDKNFFIIFIAIFNNFNLKIYLFYKA